MDPAHVERLKEEQRRAIEQTQAALDKMNNFKKDYEVLKDRLETLPHKISHDVMVPFGKLAFMPGRLVHTNEITVLLGDNWFVERSAKQACEIVGRRLDALEKQIVDLEKQKGLLLPRTEFTEELSHLGKEAGEVREIREEYDEEQEKRWKIEHRKKMREYRLQQKEERERARAEERKPTKTDEDVWARLDELEAQERAGREMLKLDEDLQDGSSSMTANTSRQYDEKGGLSEEGQGNEEEEDVEESTEDSSDEESTTVRPSTIRFTHTKTNGGHGVTFNESSPQVEEGPTIKSPADVYKIFLPDKPKSILKSTGQSSPRPPQIKQVHSEEPCTGPPETVLQQTKPKPTHVGPSAFTGAVVERQDTVPPEPPGKVDGTNAPPQKISKFKAQRMKQHRPQPPQ